MNINELKEYIANYHTSEELVVLLEIEPDELLERFEDKLMEHLGKFAHE